mgnify:CR=1 FL=1
MSDPVSVTEAALLARDQESQPWQQAFVAMLSGPLTREQLIDRVTERIGYAPRFRRLVTGWPLPTWVDDVGFSVGGHVREATLAPGERLESWLSAKLQSGLDRAHSPWEATLVHGIAPGTTALVVRTHAALVDGYDNVHLLQELFDEYAEDITDVDDAWQPSAAEAFGVADVLSGLNDPLQALKSAATGLVGMVENAVRTASATARPQHLAGVEVDLDALAAVRERFGCTTHDVILALATAGVRGWMVEHNRELVDQVALVPLAVAEPAVLESAIGCRVAPSWVALPIGVADAADRLRTLATLTRARIDTGVSVPARDLIDLAGFAPPTLHSVAAGTVAAGRPHSVMVTNVPGPATRRYLGRARLSRVYAVSATTDSQDVSVSIVSYAGRVSFGAVAVEPLGHWAADIDAELTALRGEAR